MKDKTQDMSDWKNLYKKALAEIVNVEKKYQKEFELYKDKTRVNIFSDLLEIVDDIDIIVTKSSEEHSDKELIQAIKLVKEKAMLWLKKNDIERIDTKKGDPVDTRKVMIAGVVCGEGNNVIVEVVQPGYTINNTVIRPAKVIVSKAQTNDK